MNDQAGQPIKLLITGGSGDLGSVLCVLAVELGFEVTSTYLTRPERIQAGEKLRVDLNDRDAVQSMLDMVQPEAIIHTAMPPPNQSNLRQQILTPAYHLSKHIGKGTRLVFVSTDMVFDGSKAPYREDAPPSPLSVYGQAKAEMEMMADTVARTSLIYDFEPGNKQVDWMLDRISRGEKIKLYADEMRSAIWVWNLAEALLEIVTTGVKGVLNVAGPEPISRLELGWQILTALGYDAEAHVVATSAQDTGRPADLTLDVSKTRMLLKTPLLSVAEALAQWKASKQPQGA